MTYNSLVSWFAAIAVVVLGGYTVATHQSSPEATPPSYGATPGGDFLSPAAFYAGFRVGNLGAYSTTTSSGILAFSILDKKDLVSITPNTAAFTFTFPATNTPSGRSFLSKIGEMQKTCIYNATSTSGVNIGFVAGTGVDIEIAATSTVSGIGGIPVIGPTNSGCFVFSRLPTTDILAQYVPYTNAD